MGLIFRSALRFQCQTTFVGTRNASIHFP